MAQRGAKPMPKERREKLGLRDKTLEPAAQSRKLVPLPTLENSVPEETGIPEPHRPLMTINGEAGYGRQMWNRFWIAGASWLKEDDKELLMMICEQEDERAVLRQMVFKDPNDWRARTGLRQLEKSITDNLSLLGFTPTDRARIGFRSQASDPLGDFRKRVESQRKQA